MIIIKCDNISFAFIILQIYFFIHLINFNALYFIYFNVFFIWFLLMFFYYFFISLNKIGIHFWVSWESLLIR